MAVLRNTRQDLWLMDFHRKRDRIWWDVCSHCQVHPHSSCYISCFSFGLESSPNGREDRIPQWCNWGRGVHWAAKGICDPQKGVPCVQIKEGFVWNQVGTESMVFEDWQLSSELGIHQEWCKLQIVLQGCGESPVDLGVICRWLVSHWRGTSDSSVQEGVHFWVWDERLGSYALFLSLEVWQRSYEIFLSQEKYIIDVLRRFGTMDCKSRATPMVSNLKKLHESAFVSDLVDPTMYR